MFKGTDRQSRRDRIRTRGRRPRWASISVAVFTAADSLSLHTRLAGAAREIGAGGDPVRGYLDIDAVVGAAKASGSDCIHPGYGFLAENAGFAQRCQAEGLRFIGPSPAALKLFGDKVAARAFAEAQGIPVVPGAPSALASSDAAKALAKSIGYPVMLKASAGGGGRGMRAVAKPEEMHEALARCQSEAGAALGVRFPEKIVPRPRHIEVQVLGDGQGNVVHLFERDCSVQLRHQKVVEIAPAPNLEAGLRRRILADAVTLARAARYENAGTVEFLVNPESGEHFFIECNPRIQVEHTITEQVMGFDLVDAQFRIAAGASMASRASPTRRRSACRAVMPCRRASSSRARARSAPIASRRGRACGSMPAATSGWRRRRSSIRCSPS
jgi:pyruvate carboxylase